MSGQITHAGSRFWAATSVQHLYSFSERGNLLRTWLIYQPDEGAEAALCSVGGVTSLMETLVIVDMGQNALQVVPFPNKDKGTADIERSINLARFGHNLRGVCAGPEDLLAVCTERGLLMVDFRTKESFPCDSPTGSDVFLVDVQWSGPNLYAIKLGSMRYWTMSFGKVACWFERHFGGSGEIAFCAAWGEEAFFLVKRAERWQVTNEHGQRLSVSIQPETEPIGLAVTNETIAILEESKDAFDQRLAVYDRKAGRLLSRTEVL